MTPRLFRNSAGLPLIGWNRSCLLTVNEGGRGVTFAVYRRPFGVRLYLAGRALVWWL